MSCVSHRSTGRRGQETRRRAAFCAVQSRRRSRGSPVGPAPEPNGMPTRPKPRRGWLVHAFLAEQEWAARATPGHLSFSRSRAPGETSPASARCLPARVTASGAASGYTTCRSDRGYLCNGSRSIRESADRQAGRLDRYGVLHRATNPS